ncbi:MAG TPA: GNAT family protein [Aggregatilineales bacterium]|nr:GNAT family protein [Aggregatilineales bacterium]
MDGKTSPRDKNIMIYTNNLLKGEKVHLAALNRDDLPTYQKWFANPEFLRLLTNDPAMPHTQERHIKWLDENTKSTSNSEYPFSIRALDDNRIVGGCSIEIANWASRHGEVGIFIGDPDDWGKGYGSDAMNILIRFGFMELNLHHISLNVFSYNPRAIKSYEKVGFVHEGKRREALYRDGIYHDMHIMGILQREWLAKHHPQG